jgi:hypothetical protein
MPVGFSVLAAQSWRPGSDPRGNKPRRFGLFFRKGFAMPAWMEVLINVIGYAGFIGMAMLNNSSDQAKAEEERHTGCVS